MNILTVDFGSTYTKLTAINATDAVILGTASAFTTIDSDIIYGFNSALRTLESKIGAFNYDRLLCCSSAGGGLKMVALGLVPELTAKAARLAASSAGAKVIKTYSFEISHKEQEEIYNINPDIILLCGGTDGGNKEVIIANSHRLCEIDRNFTVIVAGNKSASHQIKDIFETQGKDYIITDNVMPTFNKLDIEPARTRIREVFIQKIIDAKGLSGVQAMASTDVIPTPLAVMAGCELLSKGTSKTRGIGDFMAVDLGGATTDIYSMSDGKPSMSSVLVKGLPEPFSKRTVEGDLGMRYSLLPLLEASDTDAMAHELGVGKSEITAWVEKCIANPDTIATCPDEQRIDAAFAQKAVEIAIERHCGYLESSYTPLGEIFSQTGKDLSEVVYIIGIGGAIIHSYHPPDILKGAIYNPQKPYILKPRQPEFLFDRRYIFASMGLISSIDPELALHLMKKEII
ncbi:methylaspartate mutase accessory protein GlmL [Bacteroides sp. 51]|uniref:methylaspartate mutase accessory protein GlmL n=1 Tax=Bacteroides sp. 51 TaxID=2302938 RepID=UPI0013D0CB79|nr:methylaspartate mutase accessory protein GlmL [Bacteroides sp. 51]NDV81098.1 DNA mismatch repair protein MutL [Bacteroides sp. 51]